MGLGNMSVVRSNLGQYSSPNPWSSFTQDTISRAGQNLTGISLRQAQQRLWQSQITNARSRASTQIKISSLLANDIIRDGLMDRAADLQEELGAYDGIIREIATSGSNDGFFLSDRTLRMQYNDFDELRERISKLGFDMQSLEKSAPLLSSSAKQLADQARKAMSSAQIAELKNTAGSDEIYFAQLKNQLFLTNLAEQHAKELGPEIVKSLNEQLAETEKFLEEARPTIASQILESDALDNALNLAKNARDNIPKIGLGALKWAVIIGGGALLLGAGIAYASARALSRAVKKA